MYTQKLGRRPSLPGGSHAGRRRAGLPPRPEELLWAGRVGAGRTEPGSQRCHGALLVAHLTQMAMLFRRMCLLRRASHWPSSRDDEYGRGPTPASRLWSARCRWPDGLAGVGGHQTATHAREASLPSRVCCGCDGKTERPRGLWYFRTSHGRVRIMHLSSGGDTAVLNTMSPVLKEK